MEGKEMDMKEDKQQLSSREILPESERVNPVELREWEKCIKYNKGPMSFNEHRIFRYHKALTAAESEIERKDKEIEELKRENERLTALSNELSDHTINQNTILSKQHGITQDLQSTIDRMKQDHARELETYRK